MKGCGVPSKGNVGVREHACSQCLIVPLSLLVTEGAVFKSLRHMKRDDAALHIAGLLPYGHL